MNTRATNRITHEPMDRLETKATHLGGLGEERTYKTIKTRFC